MTTSQLPVRVSDLHRCGPDGTCRTCVEAWPCAKLRKMLLAHFMHHPDDLAPFMRTLLEKLRHDAVFRSMATEALHARFLAWVGPAIEAQRALERAKVAAGTAGRLAADRLLTWGRNLKATLLTPRFGVPVNVPRGTVYGAARNDKRETVGAHRG